MHCGSKNVGPAKTVYCGGAGAAADGVASVGPFQYDSLCRMIADGYSGILTVILCSPGAEAVPLGSGGNRGTKLNI